MQTLKLGRGRPRKEDEWRVELVKLMRVEDEIIRKANIRKSAIKVLLNGDSHAKS